jgi:hypothetical protein
VKYVNIHLIVSGSISTICVKIRRHSNEILVAQGNLAPEHGDALIQEAMYIIEQIGSADQAALSNLYMAGTLIFLPTLNR